MLKEHAKLNMEGEKNKVFQNYQIESPKLPSVICCCNTPVNMGIFLLCFRLTETLLRGNPSKINRQTLFSA